MLDPTAVSLRADVGPALLMETIVKSDDVDSFQLFVGSEADRIWVVPQEWSEKFLLPNLPRVRIILREPRVLRGTPEVFPGRAAFVDPHGGVGTATDALGALHKVVRDKPWELQQATGFGVTKNLLELLDAGSCLELVFVNTDDTSHARRSPVNLLCACPPSPPLGLTPALSSRGERREPRAVEAACWTDGHGGPYAFA